MTLRASSLKCVFACFFFHFRMAMTRRTMFQKGEVHNKPSGFWRMIKSVTTSAPGSESILCPSAWSLFCFPVTVDIHRHVSSRRTAQWSDAHMPEAGTPANPVPTRHHSFSSRRQTRLRLHRSPAGRRRAQETWSVHSHLRSPHGRSQTRKPLSPSRRAPDKSVFPFYR